MLNKQFHVTLSHGVCLQRIDELWKHNIMLYENFRTRKATHPNPSLKKEKGLLEIVTQCGRAEAEFLASGWIPDLKVGVNPPEDGQEEKE
jgi:hypothetical protein